MNKVERGQKILEWMLVLGVMCTLTGLFYFPHFQGYRNAMICLVYLPAIGLIILNRSLRKTLTKTSLLWLIAIFILFGALSTTWGDASKPSREIKYALLTLLFILGLATCEHSRPGSLIRIVECAIPIAAISALYALFQFYYAQEHSIDTRLTGYGILTHPILASFVYGFFLVVGLWQLHQPQYSTNIRWLLIICTLILSAHLLAGQNRGSIIATIAALMSISIILKNRRGLLINLTLISSIIIFAALNWDLLFSRGLSYRPELWQQGLNTAFKQVWLGHGIGSEHALNIAALGRTFQHPHNMLIQIFIDLGVLGLALWCILQATLVKRLYQAGGAISALGIGLLIFAASATLFDGHGPFVRPRAVWFVSWIPTALAVAWLTAGINEYRPKEK